MKRDTLIPKGLAAGLMLAGAVLLVAPGAAVASPALAHYHLSSHSGQAYLPGSSNDLFPSGADDATIALSTNPVNPADTLPFPVLVYGKSASRVVVSTNGNVQILATGNGSTAFSNLPLPTSDFGMAIAPYWDDLIFQPSSTGDGVYTKTYGKAPHRQFVISWRGETFDHSEFVRAEVVFTEHSNTIRTIYSSGDGASATIGIQHGPSGPAAEWSFDSPTTFAGLEIDYIWS